MTKMFVPQKKMFSPREASRIIGVAYPVLLSWMEEGKIGYYQFSEKKRKISEKHIEDFLKSHEVKPDG